MGLSCWKLSAAVILIFLWGALCSPSCPSPCLCQGGLLINCSSVGPTLPPLHLPASVTTLDLSRNALSSLPLHAYGTPLLHLTHLHLGHNLLTHLSVCKTPPREDGLCETWAPTLELLSAERNQLQHIPQGLCGGAALHTLYLPHNRISTLRAQDLRGCAHLTELHLQHNLISTLATLAFSELRELRVLDLSFNALSTFPVPAYLSLHSLHTQVEVSGNPWSCDCRLQALHRRLGVARDGPPWRVVCAEPPGVAGRELLHLDYADLTCSTPAEGAGPHQEVTVHPGAEILLPCWVSDQDLSRAFWWTPDGSVRQASAQHGGGLLIRSVGEQDQGLYVCVSGPNQEPTSTFTVYVRARGGAESTLSGGDRTHSDLAARGGVESTLRSVARTHSDLALAVCLSVFLTFIAAFVLGALIRPLLDILWGKIRAWRRPPDTPTATPYDNRGFSEEEESEQEGEAGMERLGETSMYYITIPPESGASRTRLGSTERDSATESGASRTRLGSTKRDSATEEEDHSGAIYKNIPPTRGPAPQPVPRRGQPRPQGEGLSQWGGRAHDGSTGGDQSNSSSEEQPFHSSRTVEFEPIPDPQDLGIEQYSTTGSEQSNRDLGPDCDPDPKPVHDLGPNHEPGSDLARDLGPNVDHDLDLGPNLEPDRDLDRDLGPDPDLGHDRDNLSDPYPISKEEFVAGWFNDTRPPGEDPFSAPDWTDSPWEPRPYSVQALPTDSFSPDLDPELWNDSGESFEFTDSLPETATRGSFSLPQLLEEPWSCFDQSAAGQHDSHDPALLWGGQEKDLPPRLSSPLNPENSVLHSENPESGELADAPHPKFTGSGRADAPWVIHEASQADVMGPYVCGDTDDHVTGFECPGTWAFVAEDIEGRGLSPEDTGGRGLSPEDTEGRRLSPEDTEGRGLSPEDTEGRGLSPEDTGGRGLSPEDTEGRGLSPEDTGGRGLSPEDKEGRGLSPEDKEGRGLSPEDTEGRGLSPEDIEGRGLSPEDTEGRGLSPEDTEGRGLSPEDTEGRGLSPEDTEGRGLSPEDTEGRGLSPEDTEGRGLNPEYTEGRGLSPEDTEGHGLSPQYTEGRGLSPENTEGRGLSPEDTEGRGLSPEVSELYPEPWPRLGLAQDPAGQDERFGGTDLLPSQHPTDPPYPIKPRRSFNWHTPAPPPPQQEDMPTAPPQVEWPMPVEGQLTNHSQGNLKQDWRRGGLFFQRKRAMDAFTPPSQGPPPQAPPRPGSTHLSFGSVTVQTVTMAAAHSPSGQVPLRVAGEGREVGGEEGHVTSDQTSCFLFGSCQDKGSEA